MPFTVWGAFETFRSDHVDLPTTLTSTARSSRDFLFEQISNLGKTTILTGKTQSFGSFARRTKKTPLDDIDLLAMLECRNTTSVLADGYTYLLRNDGNSFLKPFDDSDGYVNSTKVLNAVKKTLETVSQYKLSTVGRNGSAVVLDLKSYDWSFDIVPACPVNSPSGTLAYYLIPNGLGSWMRTEPGIDATRATNANTSHVNKFLPAVRVLKYWNARTIKPVLPSYYFETMLTNRALSQNAYPSLQNCIEDLLYGVRNSVLGFCPDPKGLGPNLDASVSTDTKQKVYNAASAAWLDARAALSAEVADDHKKAIGLWQNVFGPNFPAYG